jgi:hypothetical protein
MGVLIFVGLIVVACFFAWLLPIMSKATQYDQLKPQIDRLPEDRRNLDKRANELSQREEALETIAREKSQGFPWLAEAYADYFYLLNLKEAKYMETKPHPAVVSAERVREIAGKRRQIEQKLRIAQGVIKYYQELFPFLEEFLGEADEEILRSVLSRNVDEPITEVAELGIDPVRIYLSPLSQEEYERLSTSERNQLALDRYWTRSKSKWQLGRDYERWIGYIYEDKGYSVYYQGILEGLADLGRDLVCSNKEETLVVQCKRWSQHKVIHEKHINQLYGTTVKYAMDHPRENVHPVFFTTTKLSDRARDFARHLGINVAEGFEFQKYPSVKCNVSRRTGERIYHLPFDQQYDRTLIEKERNERYVETVEEAESLGFRRAWRWRGAERE